MSKVADIEVRQRFGARVKAFRRGAGATQGELADRLGLSRTSVTNIELGRQEVILSTIYRVADAFGVTPGELLTSSGEVVPEVAGCPACRRCGLPLSKNPHPDAGKPFTLLETGPLWICIPCEWKDYGAWCQRARSAEALISNTVAMLTKDAVQ